MTVEERLAQAGLVLPRPGERVALVICGANLDPATLAG